MSQATTTSTKKIAFITGANKGIGYETARQLAAGHGFTVLLGARDAARGQAAAAQLQSEGLDAHFVPLDLNDAASIQAAGELVASEYGQLDVLVNNAGILDEGGAASPSQTPLTALKATYEVNVYAPLLVTQAFLPLLVQSPAGRVVNVSSLLGSQAFQRDFEGAFGAYKPLSYNSSKAALNSITISLAYEFRNTPLKFNVAHPGYVATDINDNQGTLHVSEGAKTSVWLATLPADGPNGAFYHLGEELPW